MHHTHAGAFQGEPGLRPEDAEPVPDSPIVLDLVLLGAVSVPSCALRERTRIRSWSSGPNRRPRSSRAASGEKSPRSGLISRPTIAAPVDEIGVCCIGTHSLAWGRFQLDSCRFSGS